jgi:hypothetical protein
MAIIKTSQGGKESIFIKKKTQKLSAGYGQGLHKLLRGTLFLFGICIG